MTPESLCENSKTRLSEPETRTAPRSGIHAALWIPTGESGQVRRQSLARHLAWLKECGVHGILALGSTGEFARMRLSQREEALEAIIEFAHPLPVIANVSSISLDEVIALGRLAERLGAAGAALMPPWYFPLAQEDILEFFLRASEKIPLPFYLYNYPEVTGNRIGLEIVSAFAGRAPLAGFKQSGNELSYHEDLIRLGNEKDFSVFTAADPFLGEFLAKGAAGCLGGFANFVPEYMLSVYRACRAGMPQHAALASARLKKIGELLNSLHLPLNARSGMEARGLDPGVLKTVVSPETMAVYDSAVDRLRQAFREWELPCFTDTP